MASNFGRVMAQPAATTPVTNLNGTNSILPSSPYNIRILTAIGNTLYFVANDGTNGAELWKTDGTNATLVKNINPTGSSNPFYLTAVGSTLYFAADDGSNGIELWESDGTASGTSRVADINSGSCII